MYIADLLLETTVPAWGFWLPKPRISMGQSQDICKRLHRPLLHPSNGCGDVMVTCWKHPEPWEFWEPAMVMQCMMSSLWGRVPVLCSMSARSPKFVMWIHGRPQKIERNRLEQGQLQYDLFQGPMLAMIVLGISPTLRCHPPKKEAPRSGHLDDGKAKKGCQGAEKRHSKVRWAAHLENSSQPDLQ